MASPYYMGTDGHFLIRDEEDDFTEMFDWVVTENNIRTHIPENLSPCLIFVKTDYVPEQEIMDMLLSQKDPYVLVTGSSDLSPRLCFPKEATRLLESHSLRCWFTENNLDPHPKMKSLPVGLTYHNRRLQLYAEGHLHILRTHTRPLALRKKQIYARWRYRDNNICGSEHDQRAQVRPFIRDHPELFYSVTNEIPQISYFQELQQYQFILCPHGNGLDPSPRAWEAMILKVIPIVKSSRLVDDIYTDLPCLIIRTFEELADWKFLETYRERIEEIEKMIQDDFYLYKLSRAWWQYNILIECKQWLSAERFRILYND